MARFVNCFQPRLLWFCFLAWAVGSVLFYLFWLDLENIFWILMDPLGAFVPMGAIGLGVASIAVMIKQKRVRLGVLFIILASPALALFLGREGPRIGREFYLASNKPRYLRILEEVSAGRTRAVKRRDVTVAREKPMLVVFHLPGGILEHWVGIAFDEAEVIPKTPQDPKSLLRYVPGLDPMGEFIPMGGHWYYCFFT